MGKSPRYDGVAGEGRLVGVPKFHSWDKCTMPLTKYQLKLDVQRFLWPLYYVSYISYIIRAK